MITRAHTLSEAAWRAFWFVCRMEQHPRVLLCSCFAAASILAAPSAPPLALSNSFASFLAGTGVRARGASFAYAVIAANLAEVVLSLHRLLTELTTPPREEERSRPFFSVAHVLRAVHSETRRFLGAKLYPNRVLYRFAVEHNQPGDLGRRNPITVCNVVKP